MLCLQQGPPNPAIALSSTVPKCRPLPHSNPLSAPRSSQKQPANTVLLLHLSLHKASRPGTHRDSACTSKESRVSCCPLPGTRRLKPSWLTGTSAPAEPRAAEGGVICTRPSPRQRTVAGSSGAWGARLSPWHGHCRTACLLCSCPSCWQEHFESVGSPKQTQQESADPGMGIGAKRTCLGDESGPLGCRGGAVKGVQPLVCGTALWGTGCHWKLCLPCMLASITRRQQQALLKHTRQLLGVSLVASLTNAHRPFFSSRLPSPQARAAADRSTDSHQSASSTSMRLSWEPVSWVPSLIHVNNAL